MHLGVEEEDEAERKEYKELISMFELMYELAGILRERRFKRGSIGIFCHILADISNVYAKVIGISLFCEGNGIIH